jgi:hypothetical protein
VRASDAAALAAALSAAGVASVPDGQDELLVSGATQETVAEAAFEHRIVVYALAAEAQSLEDVFFHLTTPLQEAA